jgi:cobalt-zinc-cadmium efflux system protein
MGGKHAHSTSHGHRHDDHAHEHAHSLDGHDDHGHGHDAHGQDGHDHAGHGHGVPKNLPSRKLLMALALTGGFLLVEALAGVLTHSLALLSDAAHMLTDTAALALALTAQRLAERPRSSRHTYGYKRVETLAALANGVALAGSSFFIVREGIARWSSPTEIRGVAMFVVASLGLLVNLLSAKVLAHGHGESNANVRAALAHVLADAAGSVAAMVAGVLIVFFHLTRADSVVSIVLSLLVLYSAYKIVRDSSRVLMEGVPSGLDVEAIEAMVAAVPGVESVHDLHVWEIAEGAPVMTVHVVLAEGGHGVEVVERVRSKIRKELELTHVTVQPEAPRTTRLLPASSLTKKRA